LGDGVEGGLERHLLAAEPALDGLGGDGQIPSQLDMQAGKPAHVLTGVIQEV